MPALTACSMPRIAGRAEAEQRQSPCEKAYFDATADNKIAHDQHQHIIRRYFSAQQAVSAWTNTAAQCPARFTEGTLRSAQARHMARALGDQLSVAVAPITLSRFDDVESLDVDSKSLATAAQAEDRAGFAMEVLAARKTFQELEDKYKEEIRPEAEKVCEAGGLFILGTERHESRRIDNQLRGRAGRQGDPGETRFYISLEDDLMRLFGGDRVTGMMERMNIDEDTPIENKMLSRAIEQAQTTVESRNFQARKSVLEYDDVMNKQREIIYGQRKQVLDGMDVKGIIMGMMESAIGHQVRSAFMGQEHLDMVQCKELLRGLEGVYFTKYTVKIDESQLPTLTEDDFIDMFTKAAADFYEKKEQEITPPVMRELERVVLLRVVDEYWMDHIDAMQDLRQGIRLRAYAQTNPVDAYKKESLEMFEEMIDAMKEETVRRLYSVRLRQNEEVKRERVASGMTENVGGDGTVKKRPTKVVKVGRNDLCPCGSGLKWKKCTCKEYHS